VTTVVGSRKRVPWGDVEASAVRDLYDDYAALLDDGDYAAWLELFTEDATYTTIARENVERGLPLATMRADSRAMLADRIDALVGTQFFARRLTRRFAGSIRPLRTAPGEVEIAASFVVVESLVDEPPFVAASGAYDDEVVRVADGLRFRRKTAVYDSPLVTTSLIVPL
jgi:3-phenylpropionate/cinnamic acid dioxygenase small subunit